MSITTGSFNMARAVLERALPLRHQDFDIRPVTDVQSLNNSVWIAKSAESTETLGIRLVGPQSSDALAIDRAVEHDSWKRAAAVGITVEPIYYDIELGHAVMPWITVAREWTGTDFEQEGNRERLKSLIGRLRTIQLPHGPDSMCLRVRRMADWAHAQGELTTAARGAVAAELDTAEAAFKSVAHVPTTDSTTGPTRALNWVSQESLSLRRSAQRPSLHHATEVLVSRAEKPGTRRRASGGKNPR